MQVSTFLTHSGFAEVFKIHVVLILDELDKLPNNLKTQMNYSWIARQIHIGRALAFLLSMSDFKSETSFGFFSENYTRYCFWNFRKIET